MFTHTPDDCNPTQAHTLPAFLSILSGDLVGKAENSVAILSREFWEWAQKNPHALRRGGGMFSYLFSNRLNRFHDFATRTFCKVSGNVRILNQRCDASFEWIGHCQFYSENMLGLLKCLL